MKETMKIRITFTEPLLATCAGDPELFGTWTGNKAPENAGPEAEFIVEDELHKGSTVFMRENDKPFILDYLFKGVFKSRCAILKQETNTLSAELTNFRKIINEGIFVFPRKLFLQLPPGGVLTWLERPLRCQTMQGERVALARSECAPIGTQLECQIVVPVLRAKKDKHINLLECVHEWLDECKLIGLGQWRTASYGRFSYEVL